MAETPKLPSKAVKSSTPSIQTRHPFDDLRREVERLFDVFSGGFGTVPFRSSVFDTRSFWGREISRPTTPAVDFTDTEKAYELTAELPGIDEKNIEVNVANGILSIKGEKQEDKEEKKKDYYIRERNFGSFERSFQVPDGVDPDKIEAAFKKGVLTITLPKKPEVQKAAKKIDVKVV
jgi:HSP20 family protein